MDRLDNVLKPLSIEVPNYAGHHVHTTEYCPHCSTGALKLRHFHVKTFQPPVYMKMTKCTDTKNCLKCSTFIVM